MKPLLILAILATLLLGCATPRSPVAPQSARLTYRTYDAPKTVVWPVIVSQIAGSYPVKAVEKESGLLSTEFVSMNVGYNNSHMSEFVYPPRVFLGTWSGFRMTLTVLITEPEPGKTTVNLKTHYEAFENNVSHSWLVCQTNGRAEGDLLDKIGQALPAGTNAPAASANSQK
jgi:hypothetical protein